VNPDRSLTVSFAPGPGASPQGQLNADEVPVSGTEYIVATEATETFGSIDSGGSVEEFWYPQTSITLPAHIWAGWDPGTPWTVQVSAVDISDLSHGTTQTVHITSP
jgi:hypothetical protein